MHLRGEKRTVVYLERKVTSSSTLREVDFWENGEMSPNGERKSCFWGHPVASLLSFVLYCIFALFCHNYCLSVLIWLDLQKKSFKIRPIAFHLRGYRHETRNCDINFESKFFSTQIFLDYTDRLVIIFYIILIKLLIELLNWVELLSWVDAL